jgi:E3 ubiquitin-protein ligase TRAF7
MITFWSTGTWACERTLEGHDGVVAALMMHGDKLLSGSEDHTIKVWSTYTWECERTIKDPADEDVTGLVVLGDKRFAGSTCSSIKVWGS